MSRWVSKKFVLVVGAAGAAILAWVLAFRTGADSPDWNAEWHPPTALRGNPISTQGHKVETREEREQRLAKGGKELREELGDVKRSILGDKRKTWGDDIKPEKPDIGPDLEYNPREACMQMKLAYPERYRDVDCMSKKYDSSDVWWQADPVR